MKGWKTLIFLLPSHYLYISCECIFLSHFMLSLTLKSTWKFVKPLEEIFVSNPDRRGVFVNEPYV